MPLSSKTIIVVSVVMLVVFSAITVETINSAGSSMANTSLKGSSSSLTVYSPANNSQIFINSTSKSFSVSLSVTSNESTIYVYDLSPVNITSLQSKSQVKLYSLPNLTHFNSTLYPYNYLKEQLTPYKNTTFNLTLYVNYTQFSKMNASDPITDTFYPYVVEILVESSSGASGIGFTLMRIPA
ncbi:MAG: hypothetical protein QW597_02700 [Thermoplasmataceae archaeon]